MTREEAIAIIRKEYLCVDRNCDIERSCGKCDLMMPSKEPILQAYKIAIQALEQEPCDDVCEWFEQYVDIATDIVEFRFSDGTVKKAKRGLYLRDIEKSIRKMLIDQIANEKKQESKWIPVSERLPEKRGDYLVTQKATFTDYVYISVIGYALNLHDVDEYDFADKKRPGWYEYDNEWGYRELDDVVAWMPLPQPYKAESEEV